MGNPFVSLRWIIEKISEQSNFNIIIPEKIKDVFNCLCTPLFEKNLEPNIGFITVAKFNFINKFQINAIEDQQSYIFNNQINIKEDCQMALSGNIIYIHNCDF